MPSIEDYDSDPDDIPLDPASATPPDTTAVRSPAAAPASVASSATPPSYIAGIKHLPGQSQYKEMSKEAYAGWETLYPIYIDSKRGQGRGGRRVSRKIAIEWPIAEIMAQACGMLGVENVFEPMRSHPKDWDNPGRVKVHLHKEGRPLHSYIQSKRVLLKRICALLSTHQDAAAPRSEEKQRSRPPIHRRLPPNSPAISHGVLAAAMKGNGGLLGGLLGGGGPEEVEPPAEDTSAAQKKAPPKMPKQRRIVKRR